MDDVLRAHVRRETAVNIAVNIVIAPLLYVVMHEGADGLPAWGKDSLFVELVTQAASVAAFGSAIPSYVTWRKARSGGLPLPGPLPAPGRIIRFAVLLACAAMVLVGIVGTGVFMLAETARIDLPTVLAAKALLGGVLAAAVTPPALRHALGAR